MRGSVFGVEFDGKWKRGHSVREKMLMEQEKGTRAGKGDIAECHEDSESRKRGQEQEKGT
jgi:hypothetical protein